ncbi:MAG TPA: tRNA guanosine(34) transglycosylase Tgt [Bacteroidales bacterium]|nr:tRNA guanosine(34) transglycosylase Tgt [Bacteroidales bacterium]HOX73225.1 tRNA guanosine(34) transglycosylase Tgt [Bacteroidales bacterium]HQM68165.1 tRNA guanosine(34) transglycosylase Tgt [Bacteroidales bacterium]
MFEIRTKDKDTRARTGVLRTDHGDIPTPIFMPVGTGGTVKGILQRDLEEDIDARIILGNTYHLYLRPGTEILKEAGGLHRFMSWERPILTDSGGYQVFSLANNRKLTDEGIVFKSHIDGSRHVFTPENTVDIQRVIGADIIMALDECAPFPCDHRYAERSVDLTHQWLDRAVERFRGSEPVWGWQQYLFPIVQGGIFDDLRKLSAEKIASKDMAGNAIGGLSVGEPAEEMYRTIEIVNEILPEDRPRYLMGVGSPANILEAIERGIDMFDCVMPTRNGRNGMLFTSQGIINIRNKRWANDFSPIDPEGPSAVSLIYSKAYLRHLVISGEMLGGQISSLQNLAFYLKLAGDARKKIEEGDFKRWKDKTIKKVSEKI